MEWVLRTGEGAKRRAATRMNERSTRAHTLLLLTLTQETADLTMQSTLCFADLGGCEQLKKSGAEGDRVQEAIHINTGLLALQRCIAALTGGARYVPYQDSKLTMLLRPALGGAGATTVVVTGSLAPWHALETMQAMRFGEQCAGVCTDARARGSCVMGLLAALDAEIAECRAAVRDQERWETRAVVRGVDVEDGAEVVHTTVLCGAEGEQARLEGLLGRRRALTGEGAV